MNRGERTSLVQAAAGALVLALVVFTILALFGYEPDPLRLSALTVLVVITAWLLVGLATEDLPAYEVEQPIELWPRGQDHALSTLVRTLENHQAAATPDEGVRLRLREVAGRRLRRSHGLSLDDPQARALLGAELYDVLTGPTRRLRLRELEAHVERIENL